MECFAEPRLGPQNAGDPVSREEYISAKFVAPFIYERCNGRLVVRPPKNDSERRFSRPFRRELLGYWGPHSDLVDDVDARGWVSIGPDDDRLPDICVYLVASRKDQPVPYRVPDVIYEFVSASRADPERDYVHKRAEYHSIGVMEYVIVDRYKEGVLVLTWQPDDYAERVLGPSETYATPHLPGLEIKLSEVFPPQDE